MIENDGEYLATHIVRVANNSDLSANERMCALLAIIANQCLGINENLKSLEATVKYMESEVTQTIREN